MGSPAKPIRLPVEANEAIRIVKRLQQSGFIAYLAGGCVRDALLHRTPKDYDVATNATPDMVREIFGKGKTLAYGVSFGVIGVLPDRRRASGVSAHATEVATFRSDGTYSDGRRPDTVQFGDPEQDALRRDFTINGLFFDPIADNVIDYVGGQQDLTKGVLGTIGDPHARFGEDRLRMLRAVRFSASLGFEIHPVTEQAIFEHADAIHVISEERIGIEMRRVLVAPSVIDGLESLLKTGLAKSVIPSLLEADMELLSKRILAAKSHDFRFRLAAILSLVNDSESSLRDLTKRWRLSNEEFRSLNSALGHAEKLMNFLDLPWSQTQPIVTDRDIDFIADLAISISASQPSSQQHRTHEMLRKVEEVLKWPEEQLNPAPLLTGDDLKELGFAAGPSYAKALKKIRVLQLDGELHNRAEAIEQATEIFSIIN